MRRYLGVVSRRNPLPPGAGSVAIGLAVVGVTSYAFLIVSARALGPEQYGALSVVWAAAFLIGPGFFLPWEQELSRTLTSRGVIGEGSAPVVRKVFLAGAALSAVLLVVGVLVGPLVVSALFRDDWLLYAGVLLAIPAYFLAQCAKGLLAGTGRFGRYGLYLGTDASLRLVMCVGLAVAGVTVAGPYGITLGLAPIFALVPALWGQRHLAAPGPDVPWAPLLSALSALVVAAVSSLLVVNLPPLLVEVLAGPEEKEAVGQFTAALVLARVPLFLFQAVQAALLPQLTGLATSGRFDDFARLVRRLVGALVALAALATVAGLTIGPAVMRVVFGPDFVISAVTLGVLAAGSGMFIVASAMGQGVIALGAVRQVAAAWGAGVVAMLVGLTAGGDAVTRVQWSYLAGTAAATLVMAVLLRGRLRAGVTPEVGDVLEAMVEVQPEP